MFSSELPNFFYFHKLSYIYILESNSLTRLMGKKILSPTLFLTPHKLLFSTLMILSAKSQVFFKYQTFFY